MKGKLLLLLVAMATPLAFIAPAATEAKKAEDVIPIKKAPYNTTLDVTGMPQVVFTFPVKAAGQVIHANTSGSTFVFDRYTSGLDTILHAYTVAKDGTGTTLAWDDDACGNMNLAVTVGPLAKGAIASFAVTQFGGGEFGWPEYGGTSQVVAFNLAVVG
jgi:hypothetical protein